MRQRIAAVVLCAVATAAGPSQAGGDPYLVVRCGKQVRAAVPEGFDAVRLPARLLDLCNPGVCQVMAWPDRVRVPDCAEEHIPDPLIVIGRSATGDLHAETDCSRLRVDGAACLGL